jgi:hypothetical protein
MAFIAGSRFKVGLVGKIFHVGVTMTFNTVKFSMHRPLINTFIDIKRSLGVRFRNETFIGMTFKTSLGILNFSGISGHCGKCKQQQSDTVIKLRYKAFG